ncbi:MAG: orotidine-5'-phosphate decarboxylase [Candidatus Cloacimonas sp.]|jgi:orotidine-5'-phosphate decarboxylase|nr:orotidine-5'-phosphate decarboxylase [Candidatus Cloacimonas sp.]
MAKIVSKSFWSKYQQRYTTSKSLLCIGLDPEFSRLPLCTRTTPNPIWEFNRQLIEATADFACAFKPNLAFYLADGIRGLDALYKSLELIPDDIPVILDCKVGDIGSTMTAYVSAFFDSMQVDAITLNPLMGSDVLQPLLKREFSFAFALCLTSNPSAFEFFQSASMAEEIAGWMQDFPPEKLGAVIGATQSGDLKRMRSLLPGRIFLVPGVGAQGGDLHTVLRDAIDTPEMPNILVNSSRGIIFAENNVCFAKAAAKEAAVLAKQTRI